MCVYVCVCVFMCVYMCLCPQNIWSSSSRPLLSKWIYIYKQVTNLFIPPGSVCCHFHMQDYTLDHMQDYTLDWLLENTFKNGIKQTSKVIGSSSENRSVIIMLYTVQIHILYTHCTVPNKPQACPNTHTHPDPPMHPGRRWNATTSSTVPVSLQRLRSLHTPILTHILPTRGAKTHQSDKSNSDGVVVVMVQLCQTACSCEPQASANEMLHSPQPCGYLCLN